MLLRKRLLILTVLILVCSIAVLYSILDNSSAGAELSRNVYHLFYFLLAILFVGGITWVFLEGMLLSRLARLSARVAQIGDSRDIKARVAISGQDELSNLAGAINQMLDSIDCGYRQLQENETRLCNLFESLDEVIWAATTE